MALVTAPIELLTPTEMAEADRLAIAGGIAGLTLMENAGRAVADAAAEMVPPKARVTILCGPGNNGGDGFVVARLLADRGFEIRLSCLIPLERLKGDASVMARRWSGPILPLSLELIGSCELIVDAMFGAGLVRDVEGAVAGLIEAANVSGIPVLAVDMPSGVDGASGGIRGRAFTARRTVTFFRRKPGHLLLPGRRCCGELVLADIGIASEVLAAIGGRTWANAPVLWQSCYPEPRQDGHKYTKGHAIVVSGPGHRTGAARLAARGALRAGAGLVTVASPPDAVAVNAAQLTAIMVEPFEGPRGLAALLSDPRRNACLIGPGAGISLSTRLLAQVALEFDASVVLDADALTAFTLDQDDDADPVVENLFAHIKEKPARAVVLTPHEGEFRRVFGALTGSKLERARAAAERSGAIVILKGADTVIAAPDGRAAINENAPPSLATAGSGDVLAGFVTGLVAQGMPAWEAACAAVWLHGECANLFGPGLIAEDLPEALPHVLRSLSAQPLTPGLKLS